MLQLKLNMEKEGVHMSKRETYEARTEELITPILERMHFELVDVEYVKEGGTWYLRAYIDKEGGITVNDCEAVAREMTAEEFSELAQRKMPIFQMPNGGLLNLQYNKEKDSLDVGTVTNAGLSVKHSFPFSHDHSMDANISSAYEQLLDMEEYQKEERQEEHVAKSAFRR